MEECCAAKKVGLAVYATLLKCVYSHCHLIINLGSINKLALRCILAFGSRSHGYR